MRAILVTALLSACTVEQTAAEVGAELFADPKAFSSSQFNPYSCASCHQTEATLDPARRDAGYSLHGVAARPTFWGGSVIRMVDAVDACVVYFMRGAPLDAQSEAGRELYAYLLSISPEDAPAEPLPFTVVETVQAIAPGDAARGEALYAAACELCHGAAHTGAGSIIVPRDVILPEVAGGYDELFPGVPHGLVFIEKIRHGRFFSVGGVMPLYSREAMTDQEIGDLLAFLGLSAE